MATTKGSPPCRGCRKVKMPCRPSCGPVGACFAVRPSGVFAKVPAQVARAGARRTRFPSVFLPRHRARPGGRRIRRNLPPRTRSPHDPGRGRYPMNRPGSSRHCRDGAGTGISASDPPDDPCPQSSSLRSAASPRDDLHRPWPVRISATYCFPWAYVRSRPARRPVMLRSGTRSAVAVFYSLYYCFVHEHPLAYLSYGICRESD